MRSNIPGKMGHDVIVDIIICLYLYWEKKKKEIIEYLAHIWKTRILDYIVDMSMYWLLVLLILVMLYIACMVMSRFAM